MRRITSNRRSQSCLSVMRLLAGVLLAASPAAAEQGGAPEGPTWLSWTAAPECPSKEYIDSRLRTWLGDPFVPEKALHVVAQASFREGQWDLDLSLSYGGHEGQRRVAVATCTEAADFVAVSVALAVEPQFIPPDEETTKSDSFAHSGAKQVEEPLLSEEKSPAPVAEESVDIEEAASQEPRNSAAAAPSLLQGELGVGALMSSPPFPAVRFGAHLWAGIRAGPWIADLGFAILPPFKYDSVQAASAVRFLLLSGQFRVCRDLLDTAISLAPCVSIQVGALAAEEVDTETSKGGTLPWLALGIGAQGRLGLSQGLGIYLQPDFLVPVTTPEYYLAGNNDVVLYEVGPGFQAEAGFFLSY